jgi:hypothetical protein
VSPARTLCNWNCTVVNRVLLAVLAFLLLPVCAAALTLPEPVSKEFPDLRLAGEGRLRWFGLHVYDATLWISGPRWTGEQRFALDIRYARDFKGRKLVQSSLDEMRRLGFGDDVLLEKWAGEMTRVLPDVRKGEHLTGVYRPALGADFYHQGRLVGSIADSAFARAFFAIWLDERTREPGLRRSLIGSK